MTSVLKDRGYGCNGFDEEHKQRNDAKRIVRRRVCQGQTSRPPAPRDARILGRATQVRREYRIRRPSCLVHNPLSNIYRRRFLRACVDETRSAVQSR